MGKRTPYVGSPKPRDISGPNPYLEQFPHLAKQRGIRSIASASAMLEAGGSPEELMQFYLSVMRGEPMKVPSGKEDDEGNPIFRELYPNFKDRTHAADALSDRFWGKPASLDQDDTGSEKRLILEIRSLVAELPSDILREWASRGKVVDLLPEGHSEN